MHGTHSLWALLGASQKRQAQQGAEGIQSTLHMLAECLSDVSQLPGETVGSLRGDVGHRGWLSPLPAEFHVLTKLLGMEDEVLAGNAALCLGNCMEVPQAAASLLKTDIVQVLLKLAGGDAQKTAVQLNAGIALSKLCMAEPRYTAASGQVAWASLPAEGAGAAVGLPPTPGEPPAGGFLSEGPSVLLQPCPDVFQYLLLPAPWCPPAAEQQSPSAGVEGSVGREGPRPAQLLL